MTQKYSWFSISLYVLLMAFTVALILISDVNLKNELVFIFLGIVLFFKMATIAMSGNPQHPSVYRIATRANVLLPRLCLAALVIYFVVKSVNMI